MDILEQISSIGSEVKKSKEIYLKQLQALPLDLKIAKTKQTITQWINYWGKNEVYISFSGGKDSTVLAHIAREIYKDIKMVFIDTGLEFPEIKDFVKEKIKEGWNIVTIKPKMNFKEVIDKYGYPVISKEQAYYIYQYRTTKSKKIKKLRWEGAKKGNFKISEKWKHLTRSKFKIGNQCCDVLKKNPIKLYEKQTGEKPIIGTMVSESKLRKQIWMQGGCNIFSKNGKKRDISKPLSIWLEQDIWGYIKQNNIEIAKPYKMGYKRTGCVFCLFGIHLESKEEPNRIQRLYNTHPKLYNYCLNNLKEKEVMDAIGVDWKPFKKPKGGK